MPSLLHWWRGRQQAATAAAPKPEAVIVSVGGELTFPSPALTGYIAELEGHLIDLVAKTGHSQYEGREEVSSGSRLLLFTSDALRLCREVSPMLRASPLRHALSVRWSKEPMSAIWQEWTLDGEEGQTSKGVD